jgi:hypothetical protein
MAAATITNYLTDPVWQQYSMAVNAGDTVVWLNQQPAAAGSNYVGSFGGEWESPSLGPGDSFSYTFTNPGFYAYSTGLGGPSIGVRPGPGGSLFGVVTVNAPTDAPPLVTISTPVDGAVLSPVVPGLVQASGLTAGAFATVEYFANATLIGIATNFPYGIQWTTSLQGPYLLTAKAIDWHGTATWARPANVTVGPALAVWGARVLPTGEPVFFYSAFPVTADLFYCVAFADAPPLQPYYFLPPLVSSPGVFVDESYLGSGKPCRFYGLRLYGIK